MTISDLMINCVADLDDGTRAQWIAEAERIFFSSSLKKTFDTTEARDAFCHMWFGHYLVEWPELSFLAVQDGGVVGYLVGFIPEPGKEHDVGAHRHMEIFLDLLTSYPAHLHVNVADVARSRGVGARLIDTFVSVCQARRLSGVHIITGNGSRNNTFYRRVGFTDETSRSFDGTEMLFMGRRLP